MQFLSRSTDGRFFDGKGEPVTVRTLDRTLLSDQVYNRIRSQILRHDLAPGTRIVESEMARQFGVSQAPVRDALRKLAHEGLVLQLPHRGTFVSEISAEEARYAYQVRAALEEIAVTETLSRVDDTLLSALDGCLKSMRRAARTKDVDGLVDGDVRFHETVWRASGNPVLIRIWPMVETTMRRFTRISNTVYFSNLVEVARTHEPLLEGLRRGDKAVVAEFRNHVNEVWQRYARADESSPPRD
jgi:DNA-binding GntR family transcriptional regulator